MTLMVEGIKENLLPFIEKINHAQEMYEALLKLFAIKNIGQVAALKNELRTTNVMKPCPKIEEERDKHLRNQPLQGGNLQYIT